MPKPIIPTLAERMQELERRAGMEHKQAHDQGARSEPRPLAPVVESVKRWPEAALTWPMDLLDTGAKALRDVAQASGTRGASLAAAHPATSVAPSLRNQINYGLYGGPPERPQSELTAPEETSVLADLLNPGYFVNPQGSLSAMGRSLAPSAANLAEGYLTRMGFMPGIIREGRGLAARGYNEGGAVTVNPNLAAQGRRFRGEAPETEVDIPGLAPEPSFPRVSPEEQTQRNATRLSMLEREQGWDPKNSHIRYEILRERARKDSGQPFAVRPKFAKGGSISDRIHALKQRAQGA